MGQIWQIGLISLIGLICGSFLNCLIWRLNDGKAPKWWQGRSICPQCKRQLAWFDNVPLLSFLLLRGRCRFCRQKISWHYPAVELLTMVVFVLVAQFVQLDQLDKFVVAGAGAALIVIFFSDLQYGLIPDEAVGLILILTLIGQIGQIGQIWPGVLAGGVLAAGMAGIIFLTKGRGLGWGDVKLVFVLGLLLGWPKIMVAMWAGFILGGAVAIGLLLLRKTKLSATIPLGPFLVIGTAVAALWSNNLLALAGF